ncbi:sensor histidine kinase [Natrarchaeobius chitinivorans]|uniref:histidine kinase n=1 Tax=Natrarchaeobius chitinivorans TaxID=1679083 RepID=A0A3N6MKH1_NATCH|nr:HAMP domain-containing sensor histidine kinase [Natrarchaeobius chitinivorans]RQG96431.1 sensor histidine kinase [Natrarchaeobius chitinivorans]
MTRVPSISRSGRDRLPYLVSAFGGVSFLFLFCWWIVFWDALDAIGAVLSVGTIGLPALWLVWGGHRLARNDTEPERYERILRWCFGGALGFLAVNLLVVLFFPWSDAVWNVVWSHFAVTTGAVGGFAVGIVEAKAIQREAEATAAAVRSDQLEHERALLLYLNDLLRHEVLNSAQIVGGHASLLLNGDRDEQTRRRLETIERESDALTSVIEDVRLMLEANERPDRMATIDLSELLRTEVTAARDTHDDAEIDATVPDGITVRGNAGIKRIFSNLLENAIVHNDGTVRVELTAETASDTVVVTVTDDGSGIPTEWQETLFQRKSRHHGLGLYLVRVLTERYGGTVELTDTGPQGTIVTVTLPLASDRSADRNADTSTDVGSETDDASNPLESQSVT